MSASAFPPMLLKSIVLQSKRPIPVAYWASRDVEEDVGGLDL